MKKSSENELLEAPGLYGTLKLEEKLIQRIWNNGEFSQKNLKTSDGKKSLSYKISREKISKPYINNRKLYVVKNNEIIRLD